MKFYGHSQKWKIFWILIILFTIHYSRFTTNLMAQQNGMYFKTEVEKNKFLEVRFLLYLPDGYDRSKEYYPLLLFLHGSDESGDIFDFVKKHGPPKLIDQGKKFPFIVVSPQCPDETEGWNIEVLKMLLDQMQSRYRVKKECIFVTGLSMGGAATWELAFACTGRFAAIAPICGYVDPSKASKIKDMPVWVFHGEKDTAVPPQQSVSIVNALKAQGSPVKFTLYPDLGHDCWTETYNNDELWKWMMSNCH